MLVVQASLSSPEAAQDLVMDESSTRESLGMSEEMCKIGARRLEYIGGLEAQGILCRQRTGH
jgi:hypothetical protein